MLTLRAAIEAIGIPEVCPQELQAEVQFNVEEMHASAVKIKIGDPNVGVAGDMLRVEAARKAIGDKVTLMVDANCALDLNTSMEFARLLPKYNVYWFEEPLPIHNYEEHGKLAKMSSIKIATGENGYHLAHFKALLEKKGASILNVDVTICPGYDVAKDVVVARMAGPRTALADRRVKGCSSYGI